MKKNIFVSLIPIFSFFLSSTFFIAIAIESPPAKMPPLSTWDVILGASGVVQIVLLLLFSLSIISWTILFSKWNVLKGTAKRTERFLDIFWSGKSIDQIYGESKKLKGAPVAKVFQSGYVELQKLIEKERQRKAKGGVESSKDPMLLIPPESTMQNLERALLRSSRNEMMRLERSLNFLATTASVSPFIGLFGTVWGIMSAFQAIGIEGNASLTTVAPSISEALITTAVGLFCAIPAAMGFNYFTQNVRSIRIQVENFCSDFLNIIKRNFLTS